MVFVKRDSEFVREARYVAGHTRQSCRHALWRVEQLLSKLEGGESLNNSSTAMQLSEAREELRRALRGFGRIEKLYEDDSHGWSLGHRHLDGGHKRRRALPALQW